MGRKPCRQFGPGEVIAKRIFFACAMAWLFLDAARAEEPWSVSPECPVVAASRRAPPFPRALVFGMEPETRTQVLVATALFKFYHAAVSPADGASCAFSPTCSLYALQAVRKKGPFLGAMMAAERILRDHQGRGYSLVKVGDAWRFYDPVRANELGSWPEWPWFSVWPPKP